nr:MULTISPECIES: Shedu anti-phage system protein SduA domain-containing protein [Actinomycetes]
MQSLAFTEIKHHRTTLLAATSYRPGVWRLSSELGGAVVQAQQTVRMAARDLREYIEDRADDGSRTGTETFVVQPRSYLIVGIAEPVRGRGRQTRSNKVQSFELFRRNLHEPEVITFDELLARAEWHVTLAEHQATDCSEDRREDNGPTETAEHLLLRTACRTQHGGLSKRLVMQRVTGRAVWSKDSSACRWWAAGGPPAHQVRRRRRGTQRELHH